MKVAATPSLPDWLQTILPGAFKFFVLWEVHGVAGMNYLCPCGCGTVGEIRFTLAGQTPRASTYLWDGNREKPTIAPAIRHIVAGQVCWEGVLQAGVWIGERHSEAASDPQDPASD